MTFTLAYNWPMDQSSATATFGMSNIEDKNIMFRVGLISEKDPKKVLWFNKGWLNSDEIAEVKVILKKEHSLLVERKSIEKDVILGRTKLDIRTNWPAEASGTNITTVNYLI